MNNLLFAMCMLIISVILQTVVTLVLNLSVKKRKNKKKSVR
ncbi:hypothetical protein BAMA111019_23855 [Bacillus manliponensis]